MAQRKTYYRAEIYFGSNNGLLGDAHPHFKECIEDLQKFINLYGSNHVVFVGIQKRYKDDNGEVASCRSALK